VSPRRQQGAVFSGQCKFPAAGLVADLVRAHEEVHEEPVRVGGHLEHGPGAEARGGSRVHARANLLKFRFPNPDLKPCCSEPDR
jgi:hypothetical protein